MEEKRVSGEQKQANALECGARRIIGNGNSDYFRY